MKHASPRQPPAARSARAAAAALGGRTGAPGWKPAPANTSAQHPHRPGPTRYSQRCPWLLACVALHSKIKLRSPINCPLRSQVEVRSRNSIKGPTGGPSSSVKYAAGARAGGDGEARGAAKERRSHLCISNACVRRYAGAASCLPLAEALGSDPTAGTGRRPGSPAAGSADEGGDGHTPQRSDAHCQLPRTEHAI